MTKYIVTLALSALVILAGGWYILTNQHNQQNKSSYQSCTNANSYSTAAEQFHGSAYCYSEAQRKNDTTQTIVIITSIGGIIGLAWSISRLKDELEQESKSK